jgi:hypothetical protein
LSQSGAAVGAIDLDTTLRRDPPQARIDRQRRRYRRITLAY